MTAERTPDFLDVAEAQEKPLPPAEAPDWPTPRELLDTAQEPAAEPRETADAPASQRRQRRPRVTDDEVIEWWEEYDRTGNLRAVARRFDVPVATVYRHLGPTGLDVTRRATPRAEGDPPAGARQPSRIHEGTREAARLLTGEDRVLARAAMGLLTSSELSIMAALAKIGDLSTRPERLLGAGEGAVSVNFPFIHRRGVRYHVQSERQRAQDAMRNPGIRDELAAAGLLPSRIASGKHRYFH